MASEICRGKGNSASSDLYSAALVIWAMAAGKPPFRSSQPLMTLKRQAIDAVEQFGLPRILGNLTPIEHNRIVERNKGHQYQQATPKRIEQTRQDNIRIARIADYDDSVRLAAQIAALRMMRGGQSGARWW